MSMSREFIAGWMLKNGESANDMVLNSTLNTERNIQLRTNGVRPIHNNQWHELKPEYAETMLYNDCNEEQIKWATSQLVPDIFYSDYAAKWTMERFGKISKLYIHAMKDEIIVPSVQKAMMNEQGLNIENGGRVDMNTSHSPWLSQPEELSNHINEYIIAQI